MCKLNERSWSLVTPSSLTLVSDVSEMTLSVRRWEDGVILICLGPAIISQDRDAVCVYTIRQSLYSTYDRSTPRLKGESMYSLP